MSVMVMAADGPRTDNLIICPKIKEETVAIKRSLTVVINWVWRPDLKVRPLYTSDVSPDGFEPSTSRV